MEPDMNLSSPSQEQITSTLEEALTQEQLLNQEHAEPGDNSFGSRREIPQELYALDNLPPGYNFNPNDQDLIRNYLKKKINNERIPYNRIRSVNVYKHNPQKLAETHPSLGDNEWYFFTPRDRKYLNGTRPNRAAGNGYWKATGSDQQIYHYNACIGSKKSLVFYEGKPPNSKKSNWIMKEYMVDQPSRQQTGTNDMLLDNCVLCRIHMKTLDSLENKEQADATKSCKTRKQKNIKSCEKENQATHKRVKFEHQGTSQQHNLPGQHNIAEQHSLPVLEPNLPMQQQNIPILQYGLLPENHSLGNNLESFYGLISNDMVDHRQKTIKCCKTRKQKTIKSSAKGNQATRKRVQFEHQGTSQQHNLPGQHNIAEQHSLPVLEPNFPTQQQNLPSLQYGLLPENHSLGNNLESFYGLISNDMVDHRPNALLNHDSFGDYDLPDICDFTSYSSVDCSSPEIPLINNIDHLREGSSYREMDKFSERPPTSGKESSRGTRNV